jgi:polyphosphate kinase 2 (PPK2 family)
MMVHTDIPEPWWVVRSELAARLNMINHLHRRA